MSLQTPTSQPQSLPPTSKLSKETISKAVEALLKWIKSKLKTQKSQLFEQDDFIYLILTLKKIPPKGRTNPYKIPLPNPLHPFDTSEELCLIFDDRDRSKSKDKLNSEAVKKKIQSDNIPISKVIKVSKLKSDYRAFEAKRKLCSSYDMFFADKRIIPLLPRLLGKEFFKKKKIPIPVELTQRNWKEQIELCCKSAFFYMRSGTCCVVKVGKMAMSRDEIIDNVVAVINGVVEIIPKKWANVRSFHLKLSESLALPIYQTVPDIGLKIDGVRKEEQEMRKVDKKGESGEESVGEGKEKSSGRKKKTRGRIHEVQYMDNDMEGMLDDIFSDKDNDDDERNAIVELDSAELGGKKRKKTEKGAKDLKEKKGEVAKKKKKKNVGSLEVEGGEKEDDDKPTGEISVTAETKKSAKSKKGETTKKKKSAASSEGKGRKHLEVDEAAGGVPVSNEVTGSAKLKKSGAGKPKNVRDLSKAKADKLEDDDVAEGLVSLSSDAKKKKKSKVGSGGIKLRSKKAKLI